MFATSLQTAERLTVGSMETRLVGPAAAVGGAYSVMHQILEAGVTVSRHRHEHEDQAAVVLSGRLVFWVEGHEELEVGPGSFVSRPRGRFHACWNRFAEPATILEITSPGEPFESWMRELSDMVSAGAATRQEVTRRARERCGIEFAADGPAAGTPGGAAFWRA